MRTFHLTAATAALFLLTAPAAAASRNFGITGFTKIRVDGPFKVKVTTGVAPFAKASGSADAIDRVAIDMRGYTLLIHSSESSWGGYPGKDSGPVEVSVGSHELSTAWLNGAGSVAIDRVKGLSFALSVQGSGVAEIADVEADMLNVSLVGAASARLGGRTRKLTALLRGMSTLDAAKLDAHDAKVAVDGGATVDAQVSNEASVEASGVGTIRFTGRPACTVKAKGSASVSGCR